MKLLLFLALTLLAKSAVTQDGSRGDTGAPDDHAWKATADQAEVKFAAKSFAEAAKLFARALEEQPSTNVERPRLAFREVDARWRSLASTQQRDPSQLDAARTELEAMIDAELRATGKHELQAEIAESLGDYYFQRERTWGFGNSLQHYNAALDYWAGSSDLERARERWLSIVWRMAWPQWNATPSEYGSRGNLIDLALLEQAAELARDEQENARAYFLIARTANAQGSSPFWDRRAREAYSRVRAAGKETGLLDAALWFEGQWLEQQGVWSRDENGNSIRQTEPDQAIALYRELIDRFGRGESPFAESAAERIKQLLEPELDLVVNQAFLPGSEVRYSLRWRNIARAEFELRPVDLTRDVRLDDGDKSAHDWLASIDARGNEALRSFVTELDGSDDHRWHNLESLLEGERLEVGAYLLTARGGGLARRALVLVTNAGLIAKAANSVLLLWAVDVNSGAPLAEGSIRAHVRLRDSKGNRRWQSIDATTGADGTARIELPASTSNCEVLATLRSGSAPAYCSVYSNNNQTASGWRVHVVTDRPAYRPGDETLWKLTARRHTGLEYLTPANAALKFELRDPRGEQVESGELTLTEFGTASGSFETDANMALGEYRIDLRDAENNWIGSSTLFRLEEYKLPEFEVSVSLPKDEDGDQRVFILGDEVSAEIQARTYFGAPVSSGTAEVVVTRKPYHRMPEPRGRFTWFASSLDQNSHWRGGWYSGEEVLRREVALDENGVASIRFDTPFADTTEYVYTIEARVTDASRREVSGTGDVRVAAKSYAVEIELPKRIVAPGDPAEFKLHARDSNDAPVAVTGSLRLERARWIELWFAPDGTPIPAAQLREARRQAVFPPPGWRLDRAEYDFEEVARIELTTDEQGSATWRPNTTEAGMYVVRWLSSDPRGGEITSEQWIYVADPATTSIEHQGQGLQIVLDTDATAEGETAQILILTDASNSHVLFTVEAEQLMSAEVLALSGTVKLVRLPLDQSHVPNVSLAAVQVRSGQMRAAQFDLIVPPAKHFLDVQANLDAESYRPGDEATLDVRVLDADGEPVETELALSLIDASVLAIQGRYASDPRTFFYGHRRYPRVQMGSSFNSLSYVDLDKKDFNQAESDRDDSGDFGRRGEAQSKSRMAPASAPAASNELRAVGYADGLAESVMADSEAAPMAEGSPGSGAAVSVRSDFRETALWLPTLATAADGTATATFKFPDNTTRWELSGDAVDRGDRFGHVEQSAARTELPLVLRPQMPRFLVQGDESVLSALLNNTTDSDLEVTVVLEVEGIDVLGLVDAGELRANEPTTLLVPATGDARVDWRARATGIGEARIVMRAVSGELGDGVERRLPTLAHGIEVLIADAGRLDGGRLEHEFELPPAAEGTASMEIRVAPSLATTMLDSLPYLTHYPYGCLEQTLSRFVPTTIAIRTLERLGLDAEFVASASFGGVEQAFANKTQPNGRDDFARYEDAAAEGLTKVESLQKGDGSWSWWPEGPSNPWMTGYATWSLALAREAGLDVSDSVLINAMNWIEGHAIESRSDLDLHAWLLHAWVSAESALDSGRSAKLIDAGLEHLFENREKLDASGRALLALALHGRGQTERAAVAAENLANGAIVDANPGSSAVSGVSGGHREPTAHWGDDGVTWRWSRDAVEATALNLRALLAIDPNHELVQPAMTWLVNNRRASQWKSTRDTAIVVLALCDFLEVSGEASSPVAFTVSLDGEVIGERRLEGAELLTAAPVFRIAEPSAGAHALVIERTEGESPLYWSARTRLFSAEEPIKPRASELFVRRDVYQMVARDTLLKGKVFDRVLMQDGDSVTSGERLEVVLTLEAKNDLEYVMLEDWKPAGLEATELKSGSGTVAVQIRQDALDEQLGGNLDLTTSGDRASRATGSVGRSVWLYRELRDTRQVFFADRLGEGLWQIRTTLRAETPGTFHGLPAIGQAMYVPEIRGNSSELRVDVAEAQ